MIQCRNNTVPFNYFFGDKNRKALNNNYAGNMQLVSESDW